MDKVKLKEIREHCDRQCIRYGMNKDSDYYKEHYLIRELLDEINCDLAEYNKQIKADTIEECKQILLDAIARDGKTKCYEYMVAVNEMEQLKGE